MHEVCLSYKQFASIPKIMRQVVVRLQYKIQQRHYTFIQLIQNNRSFHSVLGLTSYTISDKKRFAKFQI